MKGDSELDELTVLPEQKRRDQVKALTTRTLIKLQGSTSNVNSLEKIASNPNRDVKSPSVAHMIQKLLGRVIKLNIRLPWWHM